MKPYSWTMLGLLIDICGAFLLSVEAIKIETFRRLRDRILLPLHHRTLSPKILFTDTGAVVSASNRFLGVFMALHWVAGMLVYLYADHLFHGWLTNRLALLAYWFLSLPFWKLLLFAIPALYCGLFLLFGIWMAGELVHISLTFMTRLLVSFVEWIDRRTPDGAVGLIGFVLLLLGFALQMYGTFLSIPSNAATAGA